MVAMVMIMRTVTLPTPPWSLRHSAANESAPLSEFQQELVTLASSLKNRFNMPPTPNRVSTQAHHFTIGEANFFIKDAVSSFMQKGMQQLQAGMDPATEVHV
jgi:phospholipase C